jgi:hypothetical protein
MSHLQYLVNRASPELLVPPAASRPALMRALTRRRLLRAMAGATGAALTAGTWTSALASPSLASASSGPRPIPGGSFVIDGQLLHVNNLGVGNDESTIFNFKGRLASTFVLGQGTAGDGTRYGHFVDMRFMEGDYVGLDGKLHNGTFAFI